MKIFRGQLIMATFSLRHMFVTLCTLSRFRVVFVFYNVQYFYVCAYEYKWMDVLFLVTLSDMPYAVRIATLTSYADDTKASQKIHDNIDVARLRQQMDSIYRWIEEINMQFNSGKFEDLRYHIQI